MADFAQIGPISTIHDLGTVKPGELESRLNHAAESYPIGLVLPITAADMLTAINQALGTGTSPAWHRLWYLFCPTMKRVLLNSPRMHWIDSLPTFLMPIRVACVTSLVC